VQTKNLKDSLQYGTGLKIPPIRYRNQKRPRTKSPTGITLTSDWRANKLLRTPTLLLPDSGYQILIIRRSNAHKKGMPTDAGMPLNDSESACGLVVANSK
jgi:hypothetical protein